MYNFSLSSHSASVVAGVIDWFRPHPQADGVSLTLYEKKAHSSEHHGDPIADSFVVVARSNSSILAVADGINWGNKPRIAARAALLGCIEYLHKKLFDSSSIPKTTYDIFHHILVSFHEGHKNIIKHNGTTTTLTVAMVCEILESPRVSSRWVLCVVSVGDSPCYVYRPNLHVVYEVTAGSHMGKGRDPRDSGGCLGANLGNDPDLSNLICCFVPVSEGDIIFLTSDGISDNFDPVLLKEAVASESNMADPFASSPTSEDSRPPLPSLTPEQRQERTVRDIARVIKKRQERIEHDITVQDLVDSLITHTVEVTDAKRNFLEKVWVETSDPTLTPNSRRYKEKRLAKESKALPGKLDHSTIVGYQVRDLSTNDIMIRPGPAYSIANQSPVRLLLPVVDESLPPSSSRQRHSNTSLRRINSMDDAKFRSHRF